MLARIERAYDHAGPLTTFLAAVGFGVLIWGIAHTGTRPSGVFLVPLGVVCLLAPWPISGWLARRHRDMDRVCNAFVVVIVAVLVLRFTGVWRAPGWLMLTLYPFVVLYMSVLFWMVSHRDYWFWTVGAWMVRPATGDDDDDEGDDDNADSEGGDARRSPARD